jgi:hypothetical protein
MTGPAGGAGAGAGGGAGVAAAGSESAGALGLPGACPQAGAAAAKRAKVKEPGISWAGFTVCSCLYYLHPEETLPGALRRLLSR